MAKKNICTYCEKNKLPKGQFRCDECAKKSVMDVTQRQTSAAPIKWKQPGGEYTSKPYG